MSRPWKEIFNILGDFSACSGLLCPFHFVPKSDRILSKSHWMELRTLLLLLHNLAFFGGEVFWHVPSAAVDLKECAPLCREHKPSLHTTFREINEFGGSTNVIRHKCSAQNLSHPFCSSNLFCGKLRTARAKRARKKIIEWVIIIDRQSREYIVWILTFLISKALFWVVSKQKNWISFCSSSTYGSFYKETQGAGTFCRYSHLCCFELLASKVNGRLRFQCKCSIWGKRGLKSRKHHQYFILQESWGRRRTEELLLGGVGSGQPSFLLKLRNVGIERKKELLL